MHFEVDFLGWKSISKKFPWKLISRGTHGFLLGSEEGSLLEEQAADVKKAAEYVTQLRRVGKGHGAYHWDKELAEKLA